MPFLQKERDFVQAFFSELSHKNPKLEGRNSKQIQMTKITMLKTLLKAPGSPFWKLENSYFEFVSDLDIRYSDLMPGLSDAK